MPCISNHQKISNRSKDPSKVKNYINMKFILLGVIECSSHDIAMMMIISVHELSQNKNLK
jgi:hypothetical protein